MTVSVLQRGREGHREEGEVHGDPLGHAVHRWRSFLRVQGERGHVDRVPPGKFLLLMRLGSYRARRGGVGALRDGVGEECGCLRVQTMWH